ncbi:hypothetical protein HDU67_000219 [Dinochytrium kinnereticum]|nr:hypothetical protein HDU67_000219 [Dinochytrium kinnereticum]
MKPAILQPKAVEKASFRVHKLKDGKVLIENPVKLRKNGQETNDLLVLTKDGVEVQDRKLAFPASNDAIATTTEAFGIIGIIELCFAKYVLVATKRTLASTIQAHKIWKVLAGQAIPIGTTDEQQIAKVKESDEETLAKYTLDQELLSHVVTIINSKHLYFSTTYDLTHSIQHNFLKAGKTVNSTIDDRYFFNLHVQKLLLEKATGTGEAGDTSPWVFKMICGYAGAIDIRVSAAGVNPVSEDGVPVGENTYTVALISRLNHRRLGTRYVRRGLDMEGNAANNVEMEQIVFHHDYSINRGISAFAQMRGSAPAVWGQELNLDYRPELLIADITKSDIWASIRKHYEDLRSQYIGEPSVAGGADYGNIVCVNLLDDKGFERQLTKTYEETVKRFDDKKVNYEEFPVNKWCKKMNFRNMDILVDRMRDRLINSGWLVGEGEVPTLHPDALLVSSKGIPSSSTSTSLRVHRLQTGIARVSCLDSLDRTNLTCSIFARYTLPFQLASLSDPAGASKYTPVDGASPNDVRDPVAGLRAAFEPNVRTLTNLWADSGDAISLLYAGTRALKSDVTRTGKRQWLRGSLDDGLNSLTRYYLNNFSDGRKQDGYDLWSGKVSPDAMLALAETDGAKKAKRLQKPFLEKGKGITGFLIPGFVIDRVEPLLQAASEFAQSTVEDQVKKAQKLQEASYKHLGSVDASQQQGAAADQPSYISFLVSAIKIYAPEQVTGVLEFVVAMVVFFYILVLVKIFQLKGQSIVDRPKLSYEYATIHELLD